jgi:hypothetical protein
LPESEREAYRQSLMTLTRDFFADPQTWSATSTVALSLLEHGTMTGRDARSLYMWARGRNGSPAEILAQHKAAVEAGRAVDQAFREMIASRRQG